MSCSVCAGRLGRVRLDECGHTMCASCYMSSPLCLVANCFAQSTSVTFISQSELPEMAQCVECGEHLLLNEPGISLPCPHSVWVCTLPLPANLPGIPVMYPTHSSIGEKRRASSDCDAADIQTFRTPALVGGTDTYCNVAANTRLLWNPHLSLEIVDDTRVRVLHCSRNLVVRMNDRDIHLMRGIFRAVFGLTDRLRSLILRAPQPSTYKPGPCRLLADAEQVPELLFNTAFQFFTSPTLNPVLRNETSRGMLMGVEPAVSGNALLNLMVGKGLIQCARCRRAWPVHDKFDPLLQTLVETCGGTGLVAGHLHAVVDRAKEISDHVPAVPLPDRCSELRLQDMWPEACEARRFLERWRQLPCSSEAAMEIPDMCLTVGSFGLLAEGVVSSLPPAQNLQTVLLELRILERWQPVPHATFVCYRHRHTGITLYARSTNTMLFFQRCQ